MRYKLYTYKNLDEYNLLYSELEDKGEEVYIFKFQETGELLYDNEFATIDITYLVEYLIHQKQDLSPAINNFENLTNNSRVIVRESLAEIALDMLYCKFDGIVNLYESKYDNKKNNILNKLKRRDIYTYKDRNHLNDIIDFYENKNIQVISISDMNNDIVHEIDKNKRQLVVNLTSVIMAVESNKGIVYNVEQVLRYLHDYIPIIKKGMEELLLDTFPHLFKQAYSIEEILEEIDVSIDVDEYDDQNNTVSLIIDKNIDEIDRMYEYFNNRLVGHSEFKKELIGKIKSFTLLNEIKQKKIFSLFLLGSSGVGKTEVARIIKDYLNEKSRLVKLNFGNYSSQNSLNNIIGSPRGYIGCEDGELGNKINDSNAGIIVCDEFEKADPNIFNFFLQLLEDGVFTNSMGKEYDLNGYIIVFTSNLTEDGYFNTISPELQSRFDFVCKFDNLSGEEKCEFVLSEIERLLNKVNIDDRDNVYLKDIINNIKIQDTDNIREIKRIVQDEFSKYIIDKNVIYK